MCVGVRFSAYVCDCERERKVCILALRVGVCLLERHMKICVFSGFAGRVCTGSHVCVSVCMRRRIHKLPAPELEGCPGASANPLLGDLGSYRFHSPALFFRFLINSRSNPLSPLFVLFSFFLRAIYTDISTTILVTWCRKIISFRCTSADYQR